MAESHKMPVVEGNGAAEAIFDQGFRYTFGLMSPGRIYLRGMLDLVKARDPAARRVAILFDWFYGHIQFDDRGINLFKPMAVEQNQTDGGIYTIGPSAEAERPMQYPAPSWNER